MKLRTRIITILGVGLSVIAATPPEKDKESITYINSIKPIFDRYCLYCHSENPHIYAFYGGNLSSFDSLKIRVDNGRFRQKVLLEKTMPPAVMWSTGPSLPDSTLKLIDSWLNAGARQE